MFDLDRLKSPNVFDDPFPILCFDNFLSQEENDKIYKSIIGRDEFDELKWSGRRQIRKGSKNYENLLKQEQTITDLYLFFNKKKVFEFFLSKFKNKSKFYLDDTKIINNFKTEYKNNFFERFKNKFFKDYKVSYLEMDFSKASKGYFREPHHDKNSRLISFLIYFNDLDPSDGGALEIFDYKKKPDVFLTQPKINDLIKVKTFLPKSRQLIVFLSNPISIHGVSQLVSSKKRVFAYGSYTLNKDADWKIFY